MNSRSSRQLSTPIMGRVILLNQDLITYGGRARKLIQHTYIDDLLKDGKHLFNYAWRQLNGLDYFKRATELTFEIQATIALVYALGGFKEKEAAQMDVLCDEIIEQLAKIANHRKSESLSKRENERT